MKKIVLVVLLLTALGCWADSLQIGPGVGTDPVLLSSGTSFTVFNNNGSPGDIATVFLFFSVPTNLVGDFHVSGSSPTLTLVQNFGAVLTSSGCGDVYTCVGLGSLNNSLNWNNFSVVGDGIAGLTPPSSYTIFEYSDGAIADGATQTFTGVSLPQGTYIDAYGVDARGKAGFSAFTHTGLVGPPGGPPPPIPEPATLALLGSGLAFVAAFARRKLHRQ